MNRTMRRCERKNWVSKKVDSIKFHMEFLCGFGAVSVKVCENLL